MLFLCVYFLAFFCVEGLNTIITASFVWSALTAAGPEHSDTVGAADSSLFAEWQDGYVAPSRFLGGGGCACPAS